MTHPELPAEGRNTGRLDDPTQLDAVAAEGTSEELPVVQGVHVPDVEERDPRI